MWHPFNIRTGDKVPREGEIYESWGGVGASEKGLGNSMTGGKGGRGHRAKLGGGETRKEEERRIR